MAFENEVKGETGSSKIGWKMIPVKWGSVNLPVWYVKGAEVKAQRRA